MTTKQIDYCIELARTLNFSRAAENLFVSQPTFSYQIKLLEEEIARFLRTFPKDDRQLFIRRYWFCDSVEELAECFGWSKSKIKSKLFRLRNRLRDHLTREGFL